MKAVSELVAAQLVQVDRNHDIGVCPRSGCEQRSFSRTEPRRQQERKSRAMQRTQGTQAGETDPRNLLDLFVRREVSLRRREPLQYFRVRRICTYTNATAQRTAPRIEQTKAREHEARSLRQIVIYVAANLQ